MEWAGDRSGTGKTRHCRAYFASACCPLAQKRGFQPHRFRYWLTEVPDAQREQKIHEGCILYARAAQAAKQGERTIGMDEFTGIQALERLHLDLPSDRWTCGSRANLSISGMGLSPGFLTLMLSTSQVIEPSWGSTRNEADCLAHLQRLIGSDATATKWHVLVDNLNIHQSESLVRKLLKRGNFRSLVDLREQILAFLTYDDRTMAHPFKWTYQGF